MNKKILLADDNEEILKTVSRVLTGYPLVTARDGVSAVALASSESPDIVLLDVAMPGLNGIEVLQKLVNLPRRPLVIMMTADESLETISKAMAIGVFSYVVKPFDGQEVLEQVKRASEFMDKAA